VSRRRCCWTTIRSATGIAPSSEVAFAELKNFGHEGSSSRLSGEQESALSDWVDTHCPRSIREIAAFLKRTFGFDYRKPEAMPRGLDDARPQAFIDQYEPGPSPCGRPERPVRPIRRKFCVRN
jgi:hypothetical protein